MAENVRAGWHHSCCRSRASRLKRVFDIDIETCRECGGAVRVIAVIEEPAAIKTIFTHLMENASSAEPRGLPASRARTKVGLSD